jgi:metallophosphoesterase (TIGR00282 family)
VIRILFIGDVVGSPGRRALTSFVPGLRKTRALDFVVANGENAAGGVGLTPDIADEMFAHGVDVITGGNHTFDKREILDRIDRDSRILRPANYPPGTPGQGSGTFQLKDHRIGVVNVMGRVFMKPIDCPFRAARAEVEKVRAETRLVFVDMHGEATSEKVAMGWYLDGKVSAVVGSHSHVQTADDRVLPGGTAYLTDAGMTGPYDSVIGIEKDAALHRFLYGTPVRFHPAGGDVRLSGAIVEIDPDSGKARSIERVHEKLDDARS